MEQQLLERVPEKVFIEGNWETREVYIDDLKLYPEPSQNVRNHSPDGFNWGYNGSGPAQLSLAILMKYLPVEEAKMYYQDFKFEVVGKWPQSDIEVELELKKELQIIIASRDV